MPQVKGGDPFSKVILHQGNALKENVIITSMKKTF